MSDTRTLIFIDDDDKAHIYEVRVGHELEDAKACYQYRYDDGYLTEKIPRDILLAWATEIEEAQQKAIEGHERREYQRLKAKFEGGG